MILAATGHRPDNLGGFSPDVRMQLLQVAIAHLERHRPAAVISGMALGWDQAWAMAATTLNIPFIAAVPFAGQESVWPTASRETYRSLLGLASEVVTVSQGGYTARKMQRRNEWMVDRADGIVALWDGTFGGTHNCVLYAEKKGKPIDNLWSRYEVAQLLG